jgi:methylthioribose-1-phosphate isomerase
VTDQIRCIAGEVSMGFETIRWDGDAVVLIDQRRLPTEETYVRLTRAEDVAQAIKDMVVRGAPAIGDTAAYGLALGALRAADDELDRRWAELCALFAKARPTAVNLAWAVARMQRTFATMRPQGPAAVRQALLAEAHAIWEEDVAACRAIGAHGAALITRPARILTHCNAGALATGGYGTALGVVRAAHEQGHVAMVFADETRPFLQGARLTAWELAADRIPVTLIADNMAGHLMARGEIDLAVTGADRIAANGDVANKIGTYMVATLCRRHGLPFYVAAPLSTIDLACPTGAQIPIEERPVREVTHVFEQTVIAPAGVAVRNPAFDVTPAELVTAIITEKGVAYPPYDQSLPRLFA